MTSMALRKCANGGLKILANGRLDTCCDPCEITIDLERKRIRTLPYLVSMTEYGSGMLVVYDFNNNETRYKCKAAFYYNYKESADDYNSVYVLEYFDCEHCEQTIIFQGVEMADSLPEFRFLDFPYICDGCTFKWKNSVLLATVDASGPSENPPEFVSHLVWQYTNNSQNIQYVYLGGEGNVKPTNMDIDNWAQLCKGNKAPDGEYDILDIMLYPSESCSLYVINEGAHPGYNPWEIHVKVYMAEVTCDPCEVAIYEATTEEGVTQVYGAGYYNGDSQEQPYKAAYLTDIMDTLTLWGFTCDTCEKVRLWSGYAGDSPEIPYREDETACDGEGEVQ